MRLLFAAALLIFMAAGLGQCAPLSEFNKNSSDMAIVHQSNNSTGFSTGSGVSVNTSDEKKSTTDESAAFDISRARIVPASEIIARIKSREAVAFDNVTISGDLDLRSLESQVGQPIKIRNSTFLGEIDASGALFGGALDFESSVFAGNSSFASAQFTNGASFAGARFLKGADFNFIKSSGISNFLGTGFDGDATFKYAQFSSLISFGNSAFAGNSSFTNAQFGGNAIFVGARFAKDADFQLTQFSRLTSFMSANFEEDADFSNSQLMGTANFMDARFQGNTSFAATRFASDVIFRHAIFSGTAVFGLANFGGFSDFASSSFNNTAYFAVAKFTDNAYFIDSKFNGDLDLESARIYSMQLDNVTFSNRSKIVLTDADFTRFVVHWNTLKDRIEYDGAAYLALVKNYKNLEWFDDADDCYYQYRWIGQERAPIGWSKLTDIIAWISCGYGVRVSYVGFWCIFTILIFGVIFWAGNGMSKFEITGLEVPGERDETINKRVSLVDALYFSTAMFTTSQAPVNNYPIGFYRHLAMVEGILGWFFLGLFIVVLSGLLIR